MAPPLTRFRFGRNSILYVFRLENQGQIEKYKKSEPRKVWIDENGAKAGGPYASRQLKAAGSVTGLAR
jgi:hypothetical protein